MVFNPLPPELSKGVHQFEGASTTLRRRMQPCRENQIGTKLSVRYDPSMLIRLTPKTTRC